MTTTLTPPPMSDEQMTEVLNPMCGDPSIAAALFQLSKDEYEAILAARDAQWLSLVGELQSDAERLDWMEKRLRGASDSERYLPFRVYWGDGRGIRKAIDAARGEKGGV